MCSRLFLCSLPNLTELEGFEGKVICCYTLPAVKAKCRELARADPLVLIAPNVESTSYKENNFTVRIISKKGYVSSDNKIKQRLATIGIKLIGQIAISLDVIQTCYRFTLIARLAPKWNNISEWLVKGNEVFETGRTQALRLDVGITTNEITLTLNAMKVTMTFFKPEDLEVSTTLLNKFRVEPDCVLNETAICNNTCYVLPNFTQAHIYSAVHMVPPSPEFNSYDRIRLHWKKQYGFILPESQNLFYQVFFKFNPGKFFSYPGCCVTHGQPFVCPSRYVDEITNSFIADIHTRMPSFCGQQIKFSDKALTPLAILQPVPYIQAQPNTKPAPVRPRITTRIPVLGKPNIPSMSQSYNKPAQEVPVSGSGRHNLSAASDISKKSNTVLLGDSTNIGSGMSLTNSMTTTHQSKSAGSIVPIFKSSFNSLQKVPVNSVAKNYKQVSCGTNTTLGTKRHNTEMLKIQSSSKRPLSAQIQNTSIPFNSRQQIHTTTPISQFNGRPQAQVVPAIDNGLLNERSDESFHTPVQRPGNNKTKKRTKLQIATTQSPIEGVSKDTLQKLHKTNISVLKTWLQQNGIKYRSKDKKDDLVRAAAQHIVETGKIFAVHT